MRDVAVRLFSGHHQGEKTRMEIDSMKERVLRGSERQRRAGRGGRGPDREREREDQWPRRINDD